MKTTAGNNPDGRRNGLHNFPYVRKKERKRC